MSWVAWFGIGIGIGIVLFIIWMALNLMVVAAESDRAMERMREEGRREG